jgi:hypothetical protein
LILPLPEQKIEKKERSPEQRRSVKQRWPGAHFFSPAMSIIAKKMPPDENSGKLFFK